MVTQKEALGKLCIQYFIQKNELGIMFLTSEQLSE